jgi:serine/threonine protein kinase
MWLGELSAVEMERLSGHLETCLKCQAAVQTLQVQDTFLDELRGDVVPDRQPGNRAAEDLIARLKMLPNSVADLRAGTGNSWPNTDFPSRATDEPVENVSTTALYFLAPPQALGELGRLGTYRVLKLVGEGGMGLVFEAEDLLLQRRVAVKVMDPSLAREAKAQERFLREARAAAALKHEHVVTIFQVGLEKGVPYLVMEFLAGESLAARLKRKAPLPAGEIARIGREITAALAVAHEKGVIHRDIKPSNVWLQAPDGLVRILDFGLARPVASDSHLTRTNAVLGSPGYMAPEQAAGEKVDARADLFSLGCVLYQMSTGRLPFTGTSMMGFLQKLAAECPSPPGELNPALPIGLSDLIMRLLEKDRNQRPTSAQEVLRELERWERSEAQTPARDSTALLPALTSGKVKKTQQTGSVPSAARSRFRGGLGLAVAALLALSMLPVTYLFVPSIIRIASNKGELVIETDDRDVEVTIKQEGKEPLVLLVDRKTQKQLELRAGDYELEVKEQPDGLSFRTKKFTLSRGGKKVVDVGVVPTAAIPALEELWCQAVSKLPPDAQIGRVAARLKELNPGFNGKLAYKAEHGVVTEIVVETDRITDISPLRALPGLLSMTCDGSGSRTARLPDFSPLRGMPLRQLNCSDSDVADLSPLTGLKLVNITADFTKVTDLSPLKGMKLTYLSVCQTQVSDLSPLKDMRLNMLRCLRTPVSDLSPVKGMRLNNMDISETRVSDLSDLKEMPLSVLHCADTQISDLSPLRGMPLKTLVINNTLVSDLSPLTGMQLANLRIDNTRVSDLSPLKNLPLADLRCDFKPERDAQILRSIPTLERINGQLVKEFWKEVDAQMATKQR